MAVVGKRSDRGPDKPKMNSDGDFVGGVRFERIDNPASVGNTEGRNYTILLSCQAHPGIVSPMESAKTKRKDVKQKHLGERLQMRRLIGKVRLVYHPLDIVPTVLQATMELAVAAISQLENDDVKTAAENHDMLNIPESGSHINRHFPTMQLNISSVPSFDQGMPISL